MIANEETTQGVYLASGFVYINNSLIENCYSASQIQNLKFNQINFSGVDENGNLLANGTYINCYYYDKSMYEGDSSSSNTTESLYNTGVVIVTNPLDTTVYYGFSIADSERDGIWRMDATRGITLIEANTISYSNRYVVEVDEDYEGATGSNAHVNGLYILMYSTLQLEGSGRVINTSLGGANNPILIADEDEFAEVFGNSNSSNIQQYYNNSYIWGTYRLVNDIDLRTIVSDNSRVLPSTTRAFAGILYGNGFEISNISITADDNRYLSYGLFASIEPRNNTLPIVTNLTLNVSQVDAGNSILVGGLSGYIKNSYIINVSINMSAGSGNISGANFAGALTGLAIGNNVFKRIEITDPTVYAIKYNSLGISDYMTTSKLYEFRNDVENNLSITTPVNSTFARRLESYSYAGSAIGYVDNYSSQATGFNANSEVYSVDNVKVSGIVNVRGEVAGGVFGLTGYQTNINDVGIEITAPMANNQSHIIAMKYFAGGIVGQSFAKLTRVYAEYDSTTQYNIESKIGSYYQGNMTVERGATDIFYLSTSEYGYTQRYVGGLVGYAESGLIEIAYSKLNVISTSAEYVGGIVGGLELDDSKVAYRYSTAKVAGSLYSTFVFNEVYATGDVRAQEEEVKTAPNAGGIVGVIKGKSKNVAFLSVNPLNYISSTNYSTGEEYLIGNTNINISSIIGVNLLVGSVYASSELSSGGSTWVEENITKSNYADYFTIYKALPNQEGVSEDSPVSSGITAETSVAVYESYFFNGQKRFFNLFGNFEADIEENQESELFYAIVSPYAYSNITAGRSYTQEAFINSGLWFSTNWNHDGATQLFPTIRYQTTTSLIYLDAYQESISQVHNIMQNNPYVTVVVRGYPSAESTDTEIVDIDLREYRDGNYFIPGGFAGTIVRYTSGANLIIDAPLTDSISPGVSLVNLSISFIPRESSTPVELSSHGIIANSITGATISNLTLNIGTSSSSIKLNGSTGSTSESTTSYLDFGLIAGNIYDTNINGITIHNGAEYSSNSAEDPKPYNGISSGTPLLIVDRERDTNLEINVGLIAGRFTQNSAVQITSIDGIVFEEFPTSSELNFNLISAASDVATMNVGGYFGSVEKSSGALDLRININDINGISPSLSGNSAFASIYVNGKCEEESTINLGGYFGYVTGLNRLGVHNEENVVTNILLYINSDKDEINTINSGIIAGGIESSTINSANMQGSDLYGHLKIASDVTVNTLNAGGIAGIMTSSTNLSYTNASSVNFEVVATSSITGDYSSLEDLDRNKLSLNEGETVHSYGTETSRVNVENAKVGGLVGSLEDSAFSANGLSVNNQVMGISTNTESTNGYSFRLNATGTVNTGSIAGYVGSGSVLRTSGTVQTATYFDVVSTNTSDNSTNIGGAVGMVTSSDGATTNVTIGDSATGYLYSGAAFVNANKINYGGTIGYSDNSTVNVSTNVTAGVLKVYGSNSEGGTVNAGGFIGNIYAGLTTLSRNVAIGDVFIEYDDSSMQNEVNNPTSLQTLSSYYFGGLIGVINTDTNGNATITAQNNATLFSNHNTKYFDAESKTVGALFGSSFTNNNQSGAVINGNYYSHGVNLTSEDQTGYGYDIGYSSAYAYNGGYNSNASTGSYILADSSTGSIFNISTATMRTFLSTYSNESNEGSKINPITIDSSTLSQNTTFNGMTYYVIVNNYRVADSLTIGGTQDLTNVAILGSGIVYNGEAYTATLANSLRDFSYISSMSVDVDIDLDGNGGGLVNNMYDNSMVYAVQVRGTLEATGEDSISIGGIVGTMYSGKIYDSSTNLTLVYRAGNGNNEYNTGVIANANVYGITGTNDTLAEGKTSQNTDKYIVNTYATGKIQTMIDTNIYAFANTTDKTFIDGTYTITKIDWNDYTTASKMTIADSNGTILAYGGSGTINNSYYDLNAFNLKGDTNFNNDINEGDMGAVSYDGNLKTRNKKAEKGSSETLFKSTAGLNSEFTSDIWFNSGYPTLKYGFMKISSLATANASKFVNSSSLSGDDKDTYIEKTTYTRLANSVRPDVSNAKDYFYLIPDYNVLTYLNNIKQTSLGQHNNKEIYINNFALTNDIDISRTTNSVTNASTALLNFVFNDGIFDGQSYTIDNLEQPLYHAIGLSDVAEKKDEEGNITTVAQDYTTIVKNLRITNANVSNAGILAAGQITNATISNITLSGSVEELYIIKAGEGDNSYNQYITVGALAPFAIDNYIFAVTNMATISTTQSPTVSDTENQKTNYGISIGVLIGTSLRNKYIFSSHYGNINVTSTSLTNSNSSNRSINVGGIAGLVAGGSISYSYNAASVLNNYAVANNALLSDNTGYFYTGGITGYSYPTGDNTITYNYTYNSGIVKSGNKSNGVTTFAQEANTNDTINGISFAGGIIGYSYRTSTTVNNSYNYGTVEALGKNGEYGFKYADDNGTLKFAMYQKSIRNVYAYAIGYNVSTSNAGALGTFKIYDKSDNNYVPDSVFANGASSEKDDWLYTENYSEMANSVTQAINKETDELINQYTYWPGFNTEATGESIFQNASGRAINSAYKITVEPRKPSAGEEATVSVLSYNSYGIPTSYSVQMKFDIKIGYKSGAGDDNSYPIGALLTGTTIALVLAAAFTGGAALVGWAATITFLIATLTTSGSLGDFNLGTLSTEWVDSDIKINKEGYDYYSKKLSARDLSFYYDQQLYNDRSQDIAADDDNLLNSENDNGTRDIRNTVNQATSSDIAMNTSIDINGSTYSIANNENISSLLQAGVAMGSGTFTTSKLPYINNIGVYDITIESTSGSYSNVNATITSITKNPDGTITFNYNYYTVADEQGNAITGGYNVTITCDYSQNYSFTTDKFSYVYLNDREFGIKLKDLTKTENEPTVGWNELLFEDDTIYYEDDEGSHKTYGQVVMLTKLDENNAWLDETIYLAYQNNMLIYIPNAYLGTGRAVNKLTTMNEDDQEIDVNVINENTYSLFTNLFSNTNYGMYIATGETTTETLSFSQGGSNTYQFTSDDLPGSISENITLSYGASQALTSSTPSVVNVTFIIKPTLNSDDSVTNYIEFNGRVIATYNNENSEWQVSQDTIFYTYNDQEYEILLSAIDGGIQMSIANLNTIDNDTLNALISDIQSKITSQTSTIGQITSNIDVALTYEYTLSPVGNFDSVGVYNNTAVLAYDASESTWVIDEAVIERVDILRNHGLSVQLAGNKLTFSVTGDSDTINSVKSSIETFMSSIDMYYEDFSAIHTITTSKTITSTKDNDDDFEVDYIAQASLSLGSTNNKLNVVHGDSNITVSLNRDNIYISDGGYTLNGINVCVGTIQFSKKLQWKLTAIDASDISGSGYISITNSDSDRDETRVLNSTNHTFGGSGPVIESGDTIETNIYSEQGISNRDHGEYNIVLDVDPSLGVVDNKLYVYFETSRNEDNEINKIDNLEIYANYQVNNKIYTVLLNPLCSSNTYSLAVNLLQKTINEHGEAVVVETGLGTYSKLKVPEFNIDAVGYLQEITKNDDGSYSVDSSGSQYLVKEINDNGMLKYAYRDENGQHDASISPIDDTKYSIQGYDETFSIYQIGDKSFIFLEETQSNEEYLYQFIDNTENTRELDSGFENIPISITASDSISLKRTLIDEIEFIVANMGISSNTDLSENYSIAIINDSKIVINEKYRVSSAFPIYYYNADTGNTSTPETIQTSKVVNEYAQNIVTYPEYQPHQIATGISDFGKFTVTEVDYVISQIDDNGNINIYLPSSTAPASTTISISVHPDNDSETCEITATEETTEETLDLDQEDPISTGTMESTKPTVAAPIILVNDIVLNDTTVTSHSPNVSIIGNDYYISYSGRTLFADSSADNQTYIKDLIMLVDNTLEDSHQGVLYSQVGNTSEASGIIIKNLEMFGALASYKSSDPALIAANGTFDDIKSFVNIDTRFTITIGEETASYDNDILTLFGDVENKTDVSVTNNGLIVVPNGIDGANGKHGDETNASGGNGEAGKNGVSVRAFSSDDANNGKIMSNAGILRVGDGGNAGAGGSTYYVLGSDGLSNSTTAKYSRDNASIGNAAGIGTKGSISGFTDESCSISYGGSTALPGVKGREPFYSFDAQSTTLTDSEDNEYAVRIAGISVVNQIVYYHNQLHIGANSQLTNEQNILLYTLFRYNSDGTVYDGAPIVPTDEDGNVKVADNDKYN